MRKEISRDGREEFELTGKGGNSQGSGSWGWWARPPRRVTRIDEVGRTSRDSGRDLREGVVVIRGVWVFGDKDLGSSKEARRRNSLAEGLEEIESCRRKNSGRRGEEGRSTE